MIVTLVIVAAPGVGFGSLLEGIDSSGVLVPLLGIV